MRDLPCRKSPEDFHTNTQEAHDAARKACAGCPVRPDCLRTAIDNDERFGIWGGLDPNERWQVVHKDGTWIDRRGVVRKPCGTDTSLKRHRALKEQCDTCVKAHAERVEAGVRERLAKEHAKGGTFYGFSLHHQLGEEPCEECRAGQGAASEAGRKTRRGRLAAA